jgi:hypothetical protein
MARHRPRQQSRPATRTRWPNWSAWCSGWKAGQLPLDQMLDGYRRGAELLALCRSPGWRRSRTQVKVLEQGNSSPGPPTPENESADGSNRLGLGARRARRPSRPRSRPGCPPMRRPAWARPCATACSTEASACGPCWCWRPAHASAGPGRGAACGRGGRADPCLLAGARRHALHGQRRAAARQAHRARSLRAGPGHAGRRCDAGAGLRGADAPSEVHAAPALQARLCALLARAAGHAGMAGGQAIDLASIGKPLDEANCATCIAARPAPCCRQRADGRGLRCRRTPGWDALAIYGAALGLAFQVVDDILDVTQESETLGKTAGKDETTTSPPTSACWAWRRERQHALALRDEAQAALGAAAWATPRPWRCWPTRWWSANPEPMTS